MRAHLKKTQVWGQSSGILSVAPERADWRLEFLFPGRAGHFEIFCRSSLRQILAKSAFYDILV